MRQECDKAKVPSKIGIIRFKLITNFDTIMSLLHTIHKAQHSINPLV